MFFAIFWCGITGILTAGVVFGGFSGGGTLASAGGLALFFGLFWAVGLTFLYAACRSKYARHRVTVDAGMTTLCRELFGRRKEMRIPTGTVKSVAAVEFYQRNYQPVYGIEIRGLQGKLRFGSMLTEEEKAWLVADLKRAVFGAAAAAEPARAARPAASSARGEFFSVPLPAAPGKWLGAGIMLLTIGIAFILVEIYLIGGDAARPRREDGSAVGSTFNFAFRGFRVMWIGTSSIFALIGIGLLARHVRTRHHQTRLEGTRDEMVLRTTKFGRIVRRQELPKGEFVDVRASRSGSSNGKNMTRIELLIGRKAHTLARWVDEAKAEEFVAGVRQALHPSGGVA